MTVCNMSIEAGARAGLIAPDDTTFEYLARQAASAEGTRPGTPRWPAGERCRATPEARFDAGSRSTPRRSSR